MSEEEESNIESVREADDLLKEKMMELLDLNHSVLQASRQMAHQILEVRQYYAKGQEICEAIAELHAVAAKLMAEATGDIISAEWGLTEVEDDEDDD